MSQTTLVSVALPRAWYRGLDRYCWVVLAVAALGWLFDTMDQNLFTLVREPSLRSLMIGQIAADPGHVTPAELATLTAQVQQKAGWLTSAFLLGWAVGGFVFGILGDRLGRTRTMIITILLYATFTGASGLVGGRYGWQLYLLMRFCTALGVGGEWAAGAALVAETFPQRSRAMALGFIQTLGAVGNMMAAGVTLGIGQMDVRWRWVYFVGAVPALLVVWVARSVREPEQWREARAQAAMGREMGNLRELFTHPVLRRNTIVAVLLGTAGVGGLWGAGFFSPAMLGERLTQLGLRQRDPALAQRLATATPAELRALIGGDAALQARLNALPPETLESPTTAATAAGAPALSDLRRDLADRELKKQISDCKSIMFLIQQLGAFFGTYCFALFAERFTRRSAFVLAFAGAWLSVLAFAWGLHGAHDHAFLAANVLAFTMGFFTISLFAGYTVYFPELFPTRLRATGCGFGYNSARILAAAAPMALGALAAALGYARATSVVTCIYALGFVGVLLAPETKGKGLPDDAAFQPAGAGRALEAHVRE